MDEIILDDGKYRFYKEDSGNLYCYRNKMAWRDFIGDHAVTALFNECIELRKELAESRQYLTMKINEAKLATMGEIIKIIQETKS